MRRWAFLLAVGALFGATPANAALKLCNRTSYVLYAATASVDGADVMTKGWTRIVPGTCQVPIKSDLIAQQYLVYARSSLAHRGPGRAWGGRTPLCVKDSDFALQLSISGTRCPGDDSFRRSFARLLTHHMRSWTLTFNDTPPEPGMMAAGKDGLDRLLRDNGLKPGDVRGFALLRKRLHVTAKASDAQLFDALETEALKSATPAGFMVCNDNTRLILVALGQRHGATRSARGWWKIAAGSCAKILDVIPANTEIYLLVQKQGGILVGGKNSFCVANIEFEIQGRENCAARGLIAAGFASTRIQGAKENVIHVGPTGLMPPLHSGLMSK